jgi:transposase
MERLWSLAVAMVRRGSTVRVRQRASSFLLLSGLARNYPAFAAGVRHWLGKSGQVARSSPYRIELTVEQERELSRRAAAYSGPWRDVVRAKAILLAAQGLANAAIAERLDVSRQSVSEWRKRFFDEGVAGLEERPRPGRPGLFPPAEVAEVKALACELPAERGVPLSRWSSAEIAREAISRGIVAQISGATVWRWLSEDAIRPWNYRSWIFPRDPDFRAKAGRVLDLYEGRWQGRLLEPGDFFVVCADEKPSIQARARKAATRPAAPGGGLLVEHEYERMGALCYLAAWDVRHARIFDRCAAKDGIEPFDALVEQFMSAEPYASAQRVFLVVDNGSAHRGKRSIDRLQGAWPNLILVHTPIHASWLNQAEIYLSVVQRKVLQPNDFADLDALEERLLAFARHYEQIAKPFQWKFTRQDLNQLLDRLDRPNTATPVLQAA